MFYEICVKIFSTEDLLQVYPRAVQAWEPRSLCQADLKNCVSWRRGITGYQGLFLVTGVGGGEHNDEHNSQNQAFGA